MKSIKVLKIAAPVVMIGLLAGCSGMSRTEQTTLSGAGIGAVAGGIIGGGKGAAIGAGVGAVGGYAVGKSYERDDMRYRHDYMY